MQMKFKFPKLQDIFWPKYGWWRTGRHLIRKLLRISSSPYSIAAGVAIGVGVSFTPFIGLHFVISFAIAYLIGANLLATGIGTVAGNPLTFPFIWASTHSLGAKILGIAEKETPNLEDKSIFHAGETLLPILKAMFVGAIPIAICAGIITYIIAHYVVSRFQEKRAAKKEMLAQQRKNELCLSSSSNQEIEK